MANGNINIGVSINHIFVLNNDTVIDININNHKNIKIHIEDFKKFIKLKLIGITLALSFFFIQIFANKFFSKFSTFLIFEKFILELDHIEAKDILTVHNILSNIDCLIVIQVIFSTLKELCLFVRNSNFFSIVDDSTINLVNFTLIT